MWQVPDYLRVLRTWKLGHLGDNIRVCAPNHILYTRVVKLPVEEDSIANINVSIAMSNESVPAQVRDSNGALAKEQKPGGNVSFNGSDKGVYTDETPVKEKG